MKGSAKNMKFDSKLLMFLLLLLIAAPSSGISAQDAKTEQKSASGDDAHKQAAKQEQSEAAKPLPGAVRLTTDRLELDDKEKIILLIGNVTVQWDDMVLTADSARVFYREIKSKSDNLRYEIIKLEAENNVKITIKDQVAVCDLAVYDAITRQIVLTGSPRVWRGKDFLSGEKITVYLDEDRSVIESSAKKKVSATLFEPVAKKNSRPRKRLRVIDTKHAGFRS